MLTVSARSPVAGSGPPAGAPITAISWRPGQEIDLAQWLDCGRKLGCVGRNVTWWIGDWLTYGNARYGERYPRAAKITGYDVQSLMNMAWVASRFDPDRRRSALSWSHHAEVAALSPAEQDAWLDRAEGERMSVRCLRTELRAHRRLTPARQAPTPTATVCPHCGKPFAQAAS